MPSALETAAEAIAPSKARTSFFDPAPGQSLVSRYANAGAAVKDAQLAADATTQLTRSRDDRLMRRRNQVMWDRDEQEFEEKQNFKAKRGEFLDNLSRIDPTADDYVQQRDEIIKALPPGAFDDDAVQSILSFKDQSNRDLAQEREMRTRGEDAFNRRMEIAERTERNKALIKGLPPERLAALRDPVTGYLDMDTALFEAGQMERDLKAAATEAKMDKAQEYRLELKADKDLTDAERKLKTTAKEHATGDDAAFPSQVKALRQKYSTDKKILSDADLKKKYPGEYADARKYDSSKFESELESARNMTEPEYMDAAGKGLSPELKEKRRTLWQAANAGAPQAAPAAPAAPAAGKVLRYNPKTRKLE